LSYTAFAYANLEVETATIAPEGQATVSFTLSNTGARAGKEVAQVYARDEVSSVTTPEKKLVAFEKIALQPGESKHVTLHIDASELALWNVKMKRVVEPGAFKVMIGSSAEDIHLQGSFDVVGSAASRK
jgi:beta-glucosidase